MTAPAGKAVARGRKGAAAKGEDSDADAIKLQEQLKVCLYVIDMCIYL